MKYRVARKDEQSYLGDTLDMQTTDRRLAGEFGLLRAETFACRAGCLYGGEWKAERVFEAGCVVPTVAGLLLVISLAVYAWFS